MKRLLQPWLRIWLKASRPSTRGFTLTELLVVAIVGSLIISGLLTLVVQLMTTDRHENVRLETNREMQLALDYMASEVKEAVYVYTGHCLMAQNDTDTNLACPPGANPSEGSNAIGNPNGGFFPNAGAAAIASANEVPVLAFWKQQPLPQVVRDQCTNGTTLPNIGGLPVPCTTASSYALVIYSLSTENAGGTWRGGARIKRYVLPEFTAAGARTAGYRTPEGVNTSINFLSWPYAATVARAGGGSAVLVDFVDATATGTPACPGGYSMSPHPTALAAAGNVPNTLRSFYACITPPDQGRNQDVLIFLQGNIAGRINGIVPEHGQLTTLQTRVMTRGVLNAR